MSLTCGVTLSARKKNKMAPARGAGEGFELAVCVCVSGPGANHPAACSYVSNTGSQRYLKRGQKLGSMVNGAVVVLPSPESATEGEKEGMRYLDVCKVRTDVLV